MNIKSYLRITQNKIVIISRAEKGIRKLYDMTKKYESTQELLTRTIGVLQVLRSFYAARVGSSLAAGDRFPYTQAELKKFRTDSRMIYNFARNKTNKEKTETYHKPIEKVFSTALIIAQYLEDK